MPFNTLTSGTGAGQIPLGGAEGAGGMGGLDGLMRMFQLIQTPEGQAEAVRRVTEAGIPPPQLPEQIAPQTEFDTATPLAQDRANFTPGGVPNQPAPGEAGLLQQGAFDDVLDPSVGQNIPGLANAGQSIPLNPEVDLASLLTPNPVVPPPAPAPIAGGGQPGLTPQQAAQLQQLSHRPQRPNLRGVTPQRGASNIQTSGITIGGVTTPRLTLAQLIGAK